MGNIGSLYAYIGADTSGLSVAEKKVSSFVTNTSRTLGSLKGVVATLGGTLAGMTAAMAITGFIKNIKEYESALVDMGKATNQSFKDIHKQIISLDAELGTSTELMRAYYQTLSSGYTEVKDALDLVTNASKMAKSAHIDQQTSVNALVAVMGAYGEELKNTKNASDLLFAVENYGITTTGELAGQIGQVANMAKQAGLSADEMGASIAQISLSSIGTAESITQLSSIVTALVKNFKDMPRVIKDYGSASNAIKQLGFEGVLKAIWDATKGNETALNNLFGRQEAYRAMLQLVKNQGNDYNIMLDNMKTKTGALDKAWKNYGESLEGIWDSIKNKGINLLTKLGYEILPALKDQLTSLSEGFDNFTYSMNEVTPVIVGLGKVIGFIGNIISSTFNLAQTIVYGFSSAVYQVLFITLDLLSKIGHAINNIVNSSSTLKKFFDEKGMKEQIDALDTFKDKIGNLSEVSGEKAFSSFSESLGQGDILKERILIEKRNAENVKQAQEALRQAQEALQKGVQQDSSKMNVVEPSKETLQAYKKMYEDMGDYGKDWLENERKIYELEAKAMYDNGVKKVDTQKWVESQMNMLMAFGPKDGESSLETSLKYTDEIKKQLNEEVLNTQKAYKDLISSIDPVIERSYRMAEAQGIIQHALYLGIITSEQAAEANKKLSESINNEANEKLLQDKMSLYKDLEGFEDEYRQTQLEWIEKIRKEEIKATGNIVAANKKASEQIAKLKQAEFEAQSSKVDDALGQMATAFQTIGNMYSESSSEYAKMQSAAKAMIVLQKAVAVATAVAAIANQGLGDPYTAFVRIAAMAAAMAGLLGSVGLSIGGGGTSAAQVKPKSTVLGAEDGKGSESLKNSYQLLEDTYSMEYQELSKLNDSMRALNNNISGLVANVLQLNISNLGGEGSTVYGSSYNMGKTVDKLLSYPLAIMTGGIGGAILNSFISKITGDWLGKAFNAVFGGKVTKSVSESGLYLGGSSVSELSSGAEVAAQAYAIIKKVKDGGWFGSDKTSYSTQYQEVGTSTQDLISSIYKDLSNSLLTLTEGFGTDLSKTLAYTFSSININLKDLSSEDINKTLTTYFSEMGDKAVESLFGTLLSGYQKVGEGLFETSVRLIRDKAVIVDILEKTGQAFVGTIPQLISFSEALIAIAGDIETLVEAAENYYDKFFTDEEKHIRLQKQLIEALANLNLVLPTTREGYRALVEGINLSTESGKNAYVSLLKWAENADEYYKTIEDASSATKDLVNQLLNYIQTVDEFISSMTLSSQFAPAISYDQIQNEFNKLYSKALLGSQEALDNLINYTQQTYLPFMQSYNNGGYQDLFNTLFGSKGIFSTLKEQAINNFALQNDLDYTQLLETINTNMDNGAQAIVDAINNQTLVLAQTLIQQQIAELQAQQQAQVIQQEQVTQQAQQQAQQTQMEYNLLSAYQQYLSAMEQQSASYSFAGIAIPYIDIMSLEEFKKYYTDNGLTGYANGGTITGNMIARLGEKGTEWVVPSYQPESQRFLKSVGVDSDLIADTISSKINGGNQHVVVQIDGKNLMDIIISNGKADYSFRKGIREIANG